MASRHINVPGLYCSARQSSEHICSLDFFVPWACYRHLLDSGHQAPRCAARAWFSMSALAEVLVQNFSMSGFGGQVALATGVGQLQLCGSAVIFARHALH